MAESEKELKSLLTKVKESEKLGLKLSIQENEDHDIRSHNFIQIDGETMETVTDFIFLGSKITVDRVTAAMKLKDTCSFKEKL